MKIDIIKTKLKIIYSYLLALAIAYLKPEKLNLKSSKVAFIMFAANYNNLGDIAITKAQTEFLKLNLSKDYEIVPISVEKTFHVYKSMKKAINKDTIITLIGGGNSGTTYEFIEWPRRFVLTQFKNCRIISFPQSVYYGESDRDNLYKNEFINICKRCNNLTLIAREQQSYDIYKEMLGNSVRILLTPDIVFSLNEIEKTDRKGVSIIFRNDIEKAIDSKTEEKIKNYCKIKEYQVTYDDTCDVHITGNGFYELRAFVNKIKKKELVITDRLHGMILAYITGTPCIALDNNNHKIKSTYDTWLGDCGRITLIDEDDDLDGITFDDGFIDLSTYFEPIKKVLSNTKEM